MWRRWERGPMQHDQCSSFTDQLKRDAEDENLASRLASYRPLLRKIAQNNFMRRLSGRMDRSDIVQDTLINALSSWASFKGTTEREFVAWLKRIMIRRSIDLLRKRDASAKRNVQWVSQQGHAPGENEAAMGNNSSCPQFTAARKETIEQVKRAVDLLPADYRDIITLRHFNGLSLREAAEQMGRSYDSAEKLWARGLARLRKILKKLDVT